MATNKIQDGKTMDFVATANLTPGSVVVLGEQIGVVLNGVDAGATGVAAMDCVYEVPKVAAAVIAAGESVIWDASAGAFDDKLATPAVGDVSDACTAWEAAGNGAVLVKVKLNTGRGFIT